MGRFFTVFPDGDVAKEFETCIENSDSLYLLHTINMRDNPTSKILRKFYICAKSADNFESKPNPTVQEFPVYAKSYTEDPIVHRKYSDSYKKLLYPYCRHFDSQLSIDT